MHESHGTGVESTSLDVLHILSEHFEQRHFVIELCGIGICKHHKLQMRGVSIYLQVQCT